MSRTLTTAKRHKKVLKKIKSIPEKKQCWYSLCSNVIQEGDYCSTECYEKSSHLREYIDDI